MMLRLLQDRLALMPTFDQRINRFRLCVVEALLKLAFQFEAALRHLLEGTIFLGAADANGCQRADRDLGLLPDAPALLLAGRDGG